MNFERVLQKVLWCLVTEGSVSYRRIKRSFGLDDDALEDVRRVLISALHIATDLDGELLVLAADRRVARPDRMALPQPLPALRHAEKPTVLAVERDTRNGIRASSSGPHMKHNTGRTGSQ